jgi:hypothetical protein
MNHRISKYFRMVLVIALFILATSSLFANTFQNSTITPGATSGNRVSGVITFTCAGNHDVSAAQAGALQLVYFNVRGQRLGNSINFPLDTAHYSIPISATPLPTGTARIEVRHTVTNLLLHRFQSGTWTVSGNIRYNPCKH